MIAVLENINQYLVSKLPEKDALLSDLESYAAQEKVPIITKEVAEFLKFHLQTKEYENALEIGTAIGYSGLLIAREIKGQLTTIEIDELRFEEARRNFERAKQTNITQILGDAALEIPKLEESYDFIFIDASKGQYQHFFDLAYPKLREGGLIFIDNILFRGYVAEDEKEIPKRYKTLVKRLDAFISYLYKKHQFCLLPFGDGIGLVQKSKQLREREGL